MSTVCNQHSSSDHCNRHYYQYLHPFDHQQQMIIENTNQQRQTTTNYFNEDENCQICGDLASGWHCG